MSKLRDNSAGIRAEASLWLAQLETGDMDVADLDAFREWVSRTPQHAMELHRLAVISRELNVLTGLAGALAEAKASRRPIVRTRPFSRKHYALVVVFAICVALAWLWPLMLKYPGQENQTLAYSTGVGEHRQYQLADGTRIHLNTDTRLLVQFAPEARRVVLQYGEAMFEVAHDRNRPFSVSAGRRRIDAIGTAFVVKFVRDELQLTVTEGRVGLGSVVEEDAKPDLETTTSSAPVHVAVGQTVRIAALVEEPNVKVESISDADMRRRLAWRDGLLDFHRTPLSQVVFEVNRYSGKHILIDDVELQAMKFDGLFRAGETDLLLEVLRLRGDIEVSELDAETVKLSRKLD